jgi:gamma-glutamyltranspeptidase/glutathione hydrolase
MVRSDQGVVVCVDEIAASVGTDILSQGGNAVDAAVAVALALAVTHPPAGNLGGGGFMVLHLDDGRLATIDYRERAPSAARADMYLKEDGTLDKEASSYGFKASGVPGTVAGLYLAHRRYGEMDWYELVEPAIKLAREGFKVDFDLASAFRKSEKKLRRFPGTVDNYFRDGGVVPVLGQQLVQPELANTLVKIQEAGRDGFYKGPVGEELVRAIQEGGGIITAGDLETYLAKERDPMLFRYRNVEVVAMGLPTSGGVILQEMLNILSGFDLEYMDEGDRAHVLAETMRRAYCDRAVYLGDPEYTAPPLDRLRSMEYATELRTGITMHAATPSRVLAPGIRIHPSSKDEQGSGSTTHFCVADAKGNVVSNTYTLEQGFGCKAVAGSTGVLMNNEMGDFNLRPGWTDEDGAIGTDPNLIEPGKRMLSSMCPVILIKNGRPFAALGSPGGRSIINTVLQVMVNVVDLKMDPDEAVKAPRLHHQWYPDMVIMEKTMSLDVQEALKKKGHKLKLVDRLGDCHAIFFEEMNVGAFIKGVADKRIDGAAVGL